VLLPSGMGGCGREPAGPLSVRDGRHLWRRVSLRRTCFTKFRTITLGAVAAIALTTVGAGLRLPPTSSVSSPRRDQSILREDARRRTGKRRSSASSCAAAGKYDGDDAR
jgi:hypothetical protein